MKQLTLLDDDGAQINNSDLGEVPQGQLATKVIRLKNTGDVALTNVRAWIEQASTADGELRVTLGGILVTGATLDTATLLGDLAPGAAFDGTAQFTTPTIPDQGTLRWKAV